MVVAARPVVTTEETVTLLISSSMTWQLKTDKVNLPRKVWLFAGAHHSLYASMMHHYTCI